MTTDMQGGYSRRSFIAAAAAAGVLAGGLVVTGAPRARAATGANVTWRLTSEPADAKTGYAAMLNGVRRAIADHRVRPLDGDNAVGHPVDVTASDGAGSFITLDVHAEDRPEFIRLFIRRSDNYILGWRQGTESGAGDVTLGYFFPLEDGVQLPGATLSNTNTRFDTLAGYDALAGQGATRSGMQITPASLHNAVLNLQDGGNTAVGFVRLAASSILQILVAVAEGSRFRNQAAATATAFGNGQPYAVTAQHMDQHNNWAVMSRVFLTAVNAASLAVPELTVGQIIYRSAQVLASVLMLVHHSGLNTKGKGLLEESTLLVALDGTGDHWTVQGAIDAVPDGGANSVIIDKGVYHEVISVPTAKTWLTIEGVTGHSQDVLIYNSRAHGMYNSAGVQYGTQGSAVATFRPANLTVQNLKIVNTFDPAAHPEISPYETQAVAVAAMGDRQVYRNVEISSRQDTLLAKGETPTTQARQYFVDCLIRGTVDFIFGNATAVIDQSTIYVTAWPGGTIVAPNTDYRKKYGILITGTEIHTDGVPDDTMYLGRPWHNSADAWPQAVIRDSVIEGGINKAHPWTDMTTDYPWSWARFHEYNNYGLGAGDGLANSPQLTDSEATSYTAQKYLAGTDGWNPVG